MSDIVDSLIIELGLDPTKYTKGSKEIMEQQKKLRESSEKTGKTIETAGEAAGVSIGGLRNQVIELFAIFTGGRGVKDFISMLTASDASTGRLSKTLNMSAENLSIWQGAIKTVGGSAEDIMGTFQNLSQQMEQFAITGQSTMIPYLRALGVSFTDAQNHIKTADQLVLDIVDSDRWKEMVQRDPAKALAFASGMGIDQNTVNLMLQGSDALRKVLAEQKELGSASPESVKAAQDFQKAWAEIDRTATDVGRKLFVDFAPLIMDVLNTLKEAGKWAREHPDEVKAIFVGLATAFTILTAVFTVGAVGAVVAGIGEIVAALGPLAAIIGVVSVGAAALSWLFTGEAKADETGSGKGGIIGAARTVAARKARSGAQSDIDYFMSKGWSREQAAGIVANIEYESAGDPHGVPGDGGKAYGLAQWHADRQADFAARYGHDIRKSTRAEQMDFINFELRYGKERPAGNRLMKATSASEAGGLVSRYYERPEKVELEARARAAFADALAGGGKYRQPTVGAETAAAANQNFDNRQSRSSEVNIAQLTVNTKATDAEGIAKALPMALRRNGFAQQANSGMN